ncbi:RibD family protein [Staphylococcus equorum]|uniref:RibD family protein n=1 Tax=Staphylococcus equorum TaxID=246432 RepID=A0A9X4LD04_9STAP|nr:RibD family protein [Staphylococcus equorum]MDG0842091.1 RibD family protein [Staphylococcus equorum]MDG0857858.1 RibD family protein [Staphylococcus equorum]
MKKPYVIIHTHTSLEGKIHAINLPEFEAASQQYQEIALDPEKQVMNIQCYLNGRITVEDNFTHYRKPELNEQADTVPEGDFIAVTDAPNYFVAIDRSGKLAWTDNVVEYGNVKSHVISILTEQVSNAYKDFLRRMNVSYIIAGEKDIDQELVLHKLSTLYNVERLMIGGGGILNWSYLQNGLVDEVSIIMSPIADGSTDEQSLFAAKEHLSKVSPVAFELMEVKTLEESVVWLQYKVKPSYKS